MSGTEFVHNVESNKTSNVFKMEMQMIQLDIVTFSFSLK